MHKIQSIPTIIQSFKDFTAFYGNRLIRSSVMTLFGCTPSNPAN